MEIYLRFGDSISFNILLWIHKQCCYYLKHCERIPGIVIFWSLCITMLKQITLFIISLTIVKIIQILFVIRREDFE